MRGVFVRTYSDLSGAGTAEQVLTQPKEEAPMAKAAHSYVRKRRPPTHQVRFTHRTAYALVGDEDSDVVMLTPPASATEVAQFR
jgi:hypothetical protein